MILWQALHRGKSGLVGRPQDLHGTSFSGLGGLTGLILGTPIWEHLWQRLVLEGAWQIRQVFIP